ncbi:MAG: MBL fold metallo-hydrolase [Campylobacter sp.]|nr:MBL fold metallo-hydrolase [Campylobacter sp.]
MKKIAALLTAFATLVFGGEIYHVKMADSDIYAISLKRGGSPVSKLIAANETQSEIIKSIEDKNMQNEHNIMLIKNPKFTALVDSGYENTTQILKQKLDELGVKFDDITHVIVTHAHKDHIGGLSNGGENNFKNAKMLIDEKEYQFWMANGDETTKEKLKLFENKMEFFKHGEKLLDGELKITAIPAYGHTPGHNMISFEANKDAKSEKLVFIADLLHVYEIQTQKPEIAIVYDSDKNEAIATREKFLQEFKKDKTKIIGCHMPFSKPIVLK